MIGTHKRAGRCCCLLRCLRAFMLFLRAFPFVWYDFLSQRFILPRYFAVLVLFILRNPVDHKNYQNRPTGSTFLIRPDVRLKIEPAVLTMTLQISSLDATSIYTVLTTQILRLVGLSYLCCSCSSAATALIQRV
jgi:hypothetical protein